ncbi:MAG: cytochrome b, partial [Chromatiales bacterium]|nr:cytochrome b [Chromatiales bacterium]
QSKLTAQTVTLHWVVGIMMLGLLVSGIYMAESEVFALYPWHKSFGVLVILFAIARVGWRIKNGWPAHVGEYTPIEKMLSKVVHYLLLIGTILMPLSGVVMSAMGGYGVSLFGLELVAMNLDPANPQEVIPINGTLAWLGHSVHAYAGYAVIAGVLLHVAGAVKHHVIDKDGTLRRMLGAQL